MDCGHESRCGHRGVGGVSLKLWIEGELLDVWLDDTGIHFGHASGTRTEGHLPWRVAIGMSLVPPGLRPSDTASAA